MALTLHSQDDSEASDTNLGGSGRSSLRVPGEVQQPRIIKSAKRPEKAATMKTDVTRESLNDSEGLRPDKHQLHARQHDDMHTMTPDPTPKAPVTSDKLFGEGSPTSSNIPWRRGVADHTRSPPHPGSMDNLALPIQLDKPKPQPIPTKEDPPDPDPGRHPSKVIGTEKTRNMKVTTLLMGCNIRWSTEEDLSDEEGTGDRPYEVMSFKEQHACITKRMSKGKASSSEKPLDEGIVPKPDIPADHNPEVVKEEEKENVRSQSPGTTCEPPTVPKLDEVDINELKNRIALQRIRLSQPHDHITPMVPDQGIIFDENNNAWLRPDAIHTAPPAPMVQPTVVTTTASENTGGSDQLSDPPSDDGGPSDDDDGDKPPPRDPFTPWHCSREGSSIHPMGSVEAKLRYTERKYQQIIEFVCKNLGKRLALSDNVKPPRFDMKSMGKYSDRDEERVLILDSLLEGKAKLWLHSRLDHNDKVYPTFVEVLIELYAWFIHESALQEAREAFRRANWEDTDETVQGWRDHLQQLVDNMDVPPDEYSLKDKFMGKLPVAIRSRVFTDKLFMEYNMLDELCNGALDVEHAI
ncbi:hypothetical protein ARMGADRAFT_1032180 [Armillaria gallica]|uniref:Uncharacterized protein n=1 Tax=Armillaria gallica TaxID=47427 RepID=A0A2H3DID7_ARMGA|nr:hypothetical protein ARMGADRAFT_1032180 [Armillaria gallica]